MISFDDDAIIRRGSDSCCRWDHHHHHQQQQQQQLCPLNYYTTRGRSTSSRDRCSRHRRVLYSAPGTEAEYCDEQVCLSVRPYVRISQEPHVVRACNWPAATALSSSGGVALRYVLPVCERRRVFLVSALRRLRDRDATAAAALQCRARINTPAAWYWLRPLLYL